MFILEKPYVSDFLIETIKKNNYSVLDNEISRKYFPVEYLSNNKEAIKLTNELFYSNSENSLNWINDNLKKSNLNKMVELSKDKALFRKILKPIFPQYYFEEVDFNNLKTFDVEKIKFPVVLKPTVGFLSFGVYPIKNKKEWEEVILKIDSDIEKFKNIFPKNVVNTSKFLIEEMIGGEEYALDAYFDENGKATILNIFQHPFFDENDVSDRVYFTSKKIIETYLDKFQDILDKIGELGNYKNFPFHLELRANENQIIPIELNPMRFCGWCITDIANYAWNINVYEYFIGKKKPDWKEILKNSDDDYFYFTIGDIPSNINRENIKSINFERYLKNIEKPLCIRKIDFKENPVFAIIFAKTNNIEEIKNILKLNMEDFIVL